MDVVGGGPLVGEQLQRMWQRGPEHRVPVSTGTRRACEIDDERPADRAGGAPGEQAMRRLPERVRAERLRNPWSLTIEDRPRRLRCHVARRESGTTGREHECGFARELAD